MSDSIDIARAGEDTLDLPRFLPYRLSVAANAVSRRLARLYQDRFDLTVPEWRVMATLGRFPGLSANQVAERTAMDKVQVSRAVTRLVRAGRLSRRIDASDRRRVALSLSPAGEAVYHEIVPLARAYEEEILARLCEDERRALEAALAKLSDGD